MNHTNSPLPPEMDRPPTRPRTYSTRREAVRARTKRLLDDAIAAAENARRRRYYGAKVQERLARLASANASLRPSRPFAPTKAMQARVRHHLDRGRDVADIAVRDRTAPPACATGRRRRLTLQAPALHRWRASAPGRVARGFFMPGLATPRLKRKTRPLARAGGTHEHSIQQARR